MAGKPLSVEEGIPIYRRMATIRAGEDRILRGLGPGEFSFTFYPVRGHEAIAATVGEVLRPDDHLTATYRCFHDIVAKGTPLREITAEQMGKRSGTSKGKGGPMHISDPRSGLMATTGIVGGGVPIAVGLALAAQLDGGDRVRRRHLRRRSHQHRSRARGDEPGRPVGVAGCLRLSEQPVGRAHRPATTTPGPNVSPTGPLAMACPA